MPPTAAPRVRRRRPRRATSTGRRRPPSLLHYRRRPVRLRSPHDREILRLALPALGALAAEPLYVLVDTAIVGHLGRPQIAALGLAGAVLSTAFTVFNFLAYGTTAAVARAAGAGQPERAAQPEAPAPWDARRDGDRAGGDGRRVPRRAAASAGGVAAAKPARDAPDAPHRPPDLRADDGVAGILPRRSVGARAHRRRAARRAPDRVRALHLPRARARRDRDRGPGDHRPDARRRRRRGRARVGGADDLVVGRGRRAVRGRAAAAWARCAARIHERPDGARAGGEAVAVLRADATARRRRVRARRDPDRRRRHRVSDVVDARRERRLHHNRWPLARAAL